MNLPQPVMLRNGRCALSSDVSTWVGMTKYLLEANLRADGSSRFQKDNRWGYFPSFSAAWRISEENFMKDFTWLDNLKIRGSYGSLGNNTLGSNRDNDGNYLSQSLNAQTNYVLGRAVANGTFSNCHSPMPICPGKRPISPTWGLTIIRLAIA